MGRLRIPVLIFVCVLVTTAVSRDVPPKPEDKPKDAPLGPGLDRRTYHVELFASLDKSHTCPGEKVRLTEMLPASRNVAVYGFIHYVRLVAHYDRKSNHFIYHNPEDYSRCDVTKEFAGLPHMLVVFGDKTWPYTATNPRENGFEFEFSPSHLGIYQITAGWNVRGENDLRSQPVILIVRPPLDDKKQPIIKNEWIDE